MKMLDEVWTRISTSTPKEQGWAALAAFVLGGFIGFGMKGIIAMALWAVSVSLGFSAITGALSLELEDAAETVHQELKDDVG